MKMIKNIIICMLLIGILTVSSGCSRAESFDKIESVRFTGSHINFIDEQNRLWGIGENTINNPKGVELNNSNVSYEKIADDVLYANAGLYISSKNQLYCWGDLAYKLEITEKQEYIPQQTNITDVQMAQFSKNMILDEYFLIILKNNGELWGKGNAGFLKNKPSQKKGEDGFCFIMDNVKYFDVTYGDVYIVTESQELYILGDNESGRIAMDEAEYISEPLKRGENVVSLSTMRCGAVYLNEEGMICSVSNPEKIEKISLPSKIIDIQMVDLFIGSPYMLLCENGDLYHGEELIANNIKQIDGERETTVVLSNDNHLYGIGENVNNCFLLPWYDINLYMGSGVFIPKEFLQII